MNDYTKLYMWPHGEDGTTYYPPLIPKVAYYATFGIVISFRLPPPSIESIR